MIFVGCQREGITQRDISQSPILKLEPVELAPKKDCFGENKDFSIEFFKTNNSGEVYERGINHVIIFNPKSNKLDFKVNVGLAHKLYEKDNQGKVKREYVPKTFREIISDENAKLKGKLPIAAINADYIDTLNKPQGLNISRGVAYAGDFQSKRSSFGISSGEATRRRATIATGRRKEDILNYNLVGGNGRFYRDGSFKDICQDLGEFACKQATNRSMVAVTNRGYVILLVNDAKANSDISVSENNQELLPDQFDNVLMGIAKNNCLGAITEAMLFDGGMSPGLYDEPKKKRGIMLTDTAWHKIQELAARNCMSASEYLEQMIRNHSCD
ncbi:phosphodiester glycosidase family protein [Dulcicalothrix desertica]|uniref:phosphodiester glycosidase family protein n=1 Tax=Dulcicalothrix desertica TaxID=32056 RepID=UPI00398A26C7